MRYFSEYGDDFVTCKDWKQTESHTMCYNYAFIKRHCLMTKRESMALSNCEVKDLLNAQGPRRVTISREEARTSALRVRSLAPIYIYKCYMEDA